MQRKSLLRFAAPALGLMLIWLLSACQAQGLPEATPLPTAFEQPTDAASQAVDATPMPGLEDVPDVDIEALIRIQSPQDVQEKRAALLEFIFGKPSLPEGSVELNTYAASQVTQPFLDSFSSTNPDILTVRMEHGLVSNMILLHAEQPSDTLVLYHTGHGGMVQGDDTNILQIAKAGYDVLFISLPLVGINGPGGGSNPPAIADTECCGQIEFKFGVSGHAQLGMLEQPLGYFFEPIPIALDYAESLGYQDFVMVGISGGGWATVVYSALDERISTSVPVAGSLPLWMRIPDYEEGDYEQKLAEFYEIANYLELYVMGAYGEGRSQFQIFNFYDPCCYGGGRALVYLSAVQARLELLGAGGFDMFIDDSQRVHMISPAAMEIILGILGDG